MKTFTYEFTTFDVLENIVDDLICDSSQMLIQVFSASSEIEEVKKLQQYFSSKYPSSHLIGTTTDGIIHNAHLSEEGKNVVSFTLFKKTFLKSCLLKNVDFFNNSRTLGQAVAEKLIQNDTKVIISFADGIFTNGEEYAKGVSSVNPDVILSGGLAADNGELQQTYVFHQDGVTGEGAVGVSLSGEALNANVSYTFDWIPVGKKMLVTKAIKNRVYEIDGMSAVEVYAKYLGRRIANLLPKIGIEFPLVFEKNGVLVGRAVLLKHEDSSLTFAGNILEGIYVQFGVGSIENILNNSDYHIQRVLDKMKYKSEAVFVYSCMARRRFMYEYGNEELKKLSKIGVASGFFTYGEFFHVQTKNQLLNETLTMLILSENNNKLTKEVVHQEEKIDYHVGVEAHHVMAHLANTVSKELAELNDSLESRVQEGLDYIYKQAYHDKLTGLPNRLTLINELNQNIGKILYLINIDDFSAFNDFYGHNGGDKVLLQLSNLLTILAESKKGTLYKLPSDEFVLVVDITHGQFSIQEKIKSCITLIEEEEFAVTKEHTTHISVTVAAAFINETTSALVNADMSLKLAKKIGKSFIIYNEDLELAKEYEANIKIANIIRFAINNDNIVPYYQPLYSFKTKRIEKYEALVRLVQNSSTILPPAAFLEASMKIKLYPQITTIMIEKCFSYFAQRGVQFSINLSFSDILDEKTNTYLFDKIQEYDIASQLTIEILETQENDNDSLVKDFIDKVYAVGANIAIDDFGSGFANFEYVTTMHSDILKIDGSLIKNIDKDKNARLVVETIIVFARKLNKLIVAEYVHSKEVFDVVKELGVDYAQGYYIGKPQAEIL